MDTFTETKNSTKDLQNRIQEHLETLAQATDEARKSKEMLFYLDFVSKFHEYSPGNIYLILLSRPDSTFIAGYHKWQTLNRWVRKGERGIPILAPMFIKQEDNDGVEKQRLLGFKVTYVFDIKQTEGQPLPPAPDWKSPQKNEELNCKLIQFAENQGISVTFKNLPGEMQGMSKGGSIDIDIFGGTSTLIHELAHEMMHKNENNLQERALKELEAESVAYIVSRHFGLESLNCSNYISLHGITSEQILAHMARISATAHSIITAIYTNN